MLFYLFTQINYQNPKIGSRVCTDEEISQCILNKSCSWGELTKSCYIPKKVALQAQKTLSQRQELHNTNSYAQSTEKSNAICDIYNSDYLSLKLDSLSGHPHPEKLSFIAEQCAVDPRCEWNSEEELCSSSEKGFVEDTSDIWL